MRIETSIVRNSPIASAEAARRAEAAGYDTVVTMENQHDPFLPLATAAMTTSRVRLATSVAIAFPRSPMVVANTARDLQVASQGRFELGLGSQVRGHNERRFSVPWSAPVPRLREYVLALRAIWRCWEEDEPLDFQGEHYQLTLMPPNFKPPPSGLPPVRVSLAAVGPAMLRLAGEVCDGVRLHPFCTRRYLEQVVMPQLEVGLARSGRARADLEIHGGGFVVTGASDAEVSEHFEFVRQRVAFYGSTRAYFPVWAEHGFEDLGEKLRGMSLRGEWAAMPAEIPDDVVHLFAAVGQHDEIGNAVAARFADLADSIAITSTAGANPAAGAGPLLPASVVAELQRVN